MPLFISNSNDRLPVGPWFRSWLFIIFFTLLIIISFELVIRNKGWDPSLIDSRERWALQRKKVNELGNNGLILVGASRIQLGIDTNYIRKHTSFVPIQLAIDGESFMPVLEDLSNDNHVTGTIIVSISMHQIKPITNLEGSSQWVNYYNKYFKSNRSIEPYRTINNKIKEYIENRLVTRLEGAKPITVILTRAFDSNVVGNYLITHYDRSRDADYNKTKMPDFYIKRLERHFGGKALEDKTRLSTRQILSVYKEMINTLKPVNNKDFIQGLNHLLSYIKKIESHGGKVILVRFPTDKLILEIDKKRYPREKYFDEIVKNYEQTLHFLDYPELSNFRLPDGSHLDVRDKKNFTKALFKILQAKLWL